MFPTQDYPDLLVGMGDMDDAAVWRLDEDRALVVTTDFFTPVVDDPYDYGLIAAANALSDIYAMGAKPFLALNIAAMPVDLANDVISRIFQGGADKIREAGAVIAGGHTIQDPEPKYGLVVVGMANIDNLMTKSGFEEGEVLFLTKPLGTGVTSTALKNDAASDDHVAEAVSWMSRLNNDSAELAAGVGVKGATDITGFGLLGHGLEIAEGSKVALKLYLPAIPFLTGARTYAEGGHFPSGSVDNRTHFMDRITFESSVDELNQYLLFDAQTSGGLFFATPVEQIETLLFRAKEQGVPIWPIGVVEKGEGIKVVNKELEGFDPSIDLGAKVSFATKG